MKTGKKNTPTMLSKALDWQMIMAPKKTTEISKSLSADNTSPRPINIFQWHKEINNLEIISGIGGEYPVC